VIIRNRYLNELQQRVLVYDGAMGTNLQRLNLTAEDFGGERFWGCNDFLVITKPQAVEQIHRGFLEVGCDVIETNTFRSNRITLGEYGLAERVIEINCTAARLARRLADEYSTPEKPRFVAGSIGPSGKLPSTADPALSDVTFQELVDVFREQAVGLIQGGCDVLLIETSQDILEVKAAIHGCHRAYHETGVRLPLQCQVTLDTAGRMLLGTDIAAVLTTLENLPIDVIGLNCSTGPEHMRDPIRYLCEHSRLPVSCIPNAGLPVNDGTGQAIYLLEPEPMAEELAHFVAEWGVNVVGGCCGTRPEHIRALLEKVGRRAPRPRLVEGSQAVIPRVSSAIRAVPLIQEPPPLLVGERLNTQGSRKVKQLLLEERYDELVEIARQQVEGGAHVLDVCMALTERPDEAEQMRRVIKLLSLNVEAPLMIDSTEPDVIQAALETYPGRAIINSINMEDGRGRIDAVMPLVVAHGAAVIALTIDEQGMAKTAERKLEVARKIYEIVVGEYGLRPDALIFDALTFTLATGDPELADSAAQTIEGIRLIQRELPGVLTSLGVSNVSFGLAPAARRVLNSVFLYHCVSAGLDMALVNPAHISPYAEIPQDQRALAEDLIFNRHPDALARYIAAFEGVEQEAEERKRDVTQGMTVEERIHWHIVHRRKEGIEELIDRAVADHDAVWVLNNVLLPAMREVGDKFGAGELILPFVLQSAEVMKRAVARLETYMERLEGKTKGKVVLATVYGDVHDIGKNLVDTILTNNGYTVYNLGKQVPVNVIIDRAVEVGADAIGLSALLVSTSKQMPLCVAELHHRGLQIPVLIGGAAIDRRFGRRILFVQDDQPYAGGVFYCNDAFEGLAVMDALMDPERRQELLERIVREAREDAYLRTERMEIGEGRLEIRAVGDAPDIPEPPFWGWRHIPKIPLNEVFQYLDFEALFRRAWGGKGKRGQEWDELVNRDFRPRLERMQREAIVKGYLHPQAVYGYFPCQADGDDLIVYITRFPQPSPRNTHHAIRFTFPRQRGHSRLCLADYFAPVDSGRMDMVAFQVVTVGDGVNRLRAELEAAGDYSQAYYVHGLSVETAEATAEWVSRRIRRELGLPESRGLRYSWGYGACPDLAEHLKVFEVLPVRETIGVDLTSAYQLVPEQSTAALFVHHPEARYFSAR